MSAIGDLFLRLAVQDTGVEPQVVGIANKAGAAAGRSLGQNMASGLSQGVTQLGGALAGIGKGLTTTGRSMVTNLTLPLLAAGAATTHFALDFDTAMRRIVGLAKVPKAGIAGVRQEILDMATDVGRAPQELAEAFYFVASAGFKADEAMKVLDTSARAAASGMGQTQDIAKVLGGVLNAYGHENISAAKAGDILTAAIQDGSAEAADFAGSIGMVVPNAAALGVSFDQVAAAMSAMTQVGVSAETAAVNLGQVLSALQKPTNQAEEALRSMGLSSAGLRQELREQGLLATLRTLEERLGGNEVAAAAVFGNIRALRGVTQLLGLDTQQLNGIFADTEGALGNLGQAYEDTEGPQRKLDRALASLQVTAIELGADVLPVVVDVLQQIADGAAGLARWWSTLDAGTRRQVVQWLAWLAVAGPTILVVGKLASGLAAVFKAVGFLTGAKGIPALIGVIKTMSLLQLGQLGVALAALIVLSDQLKAPPVGELVDGWKQLASEGTYSIALVAEAVEALRVKMGVSLPKAQQALLHYLASTGGSVDDWVTQWREGGDAAAAALNNVVNVADTATRDTAAALREGGGGVKHATEELVGDVVVTLEDGQYQVGPAAETMVDPVAEAIEKAKQDVADAAKDLLSAMVATLFEGQGDLREASQKVIDDILHPYADTKRRLDIEAELARGVWIKGLTSPDSQDRAQTAEYLNGLIAQYELLAPGALGAGKLVNPALQAGIASNLTALTTYLNSLNTSMLSPFDLADELERQGNTDLAAFVRGVEMTRLGKLTNELTTIQRDVHRRLDMNLQTTGYNVGYSYGTGLYNAGGYVGDAAQFLAHKVSGFLEFQGSPAYTHSREIGGKVGESWITEMRKRVVELLPALARTVGQVGDTLVPTPGAFAMAGVPLPAMGAVAASAAARGALQTTPPGATTTSIGGDTYILNATGPLPVREAEDAIWELRRLAGIKKQ